MGRNNERYMIEGQGVAKVFKDFWGRPKVRALNGVNIAVPEGAIFGLLGPNGAGKSTLIKLILGHLYPSSGTLKVLGKSPRDVGIKQRIGYVPERTSFYTNLTAKETLMFFGRLLGMSDAETGRRIGQLLKMVGLEHTAGRMVGEFSHGMRKRLALAQALLNDPDLLLLDEPTAGLDPIGCREIKDLILTLGKRGKTILMTSHLLADVQDVSDNIMIVYGGLVQASGTVEELLAKKDEILIRSSAVPDGILEEVKGVLAKGGNNKAEISYPKISLEEYFLSVVAEASKSAQGTSGAAMGEGVADYLKEGLDSEALDSLTKNETAQETEVEQESAPIDKDVLESISKKEEAPPEKPQIDEDVLSKLTKK